MLHDFAHDFAAPVAVVCVMNTTAQEIQNHNDVMSEIIICRNPEACEIGGI